MRSWVMGTYKSYLQLRVATDNMDFENSRLLIIIDDSKKV